MDIPWVIKYRPNQIKDVQIDVDLKNIFLTFSKDCNFPNLILSGPPGCGKTSISNCLAREILLDKYNTNCLELNASDDRGIEVIRKKIKEFSQVKHENKNSIISKIIILDESDMLTHASQQALRVVIESSESTRFIFCCNNLENIIDPVQSRCNLIKFPKLSTFLQIGGLEKIIFNENMEYDKPGLEYLIYASEGDLRKAINNLQAIFISYNILVKETVLKVCQIPDLKEINTIVNSLTCGDLKRAVSVTNIQTLKGYNYNEILNNVINLLENKNKIFKSSYLKILEEIRNFKTNQSKKLNLANIIKFYCIICKIFI